MRVVLDTNILISAALKERSLPALSVALACRRGTILKSIETERELLAVMARPRLAPLIAPAFRRWTIAMLESAEAIEIVERVEACRDPNDDKFLELAVNGRANLILSGDADLRALDGYRGISVLDPAAFVRSLGG